MLLHDSAGSAISTQSKDLPAPKDNSRKWLVGGGTAIVYGGSFIFLSQAWYKGYPKSAFHTFNDIGEWQQMDKAGHAWTTYHTSRITSDLWRWAGVDDNTSVLLGTGESLLYMLSIEYLDGHSTEWGWSWPDAGADLFGGFLYASQQLAWKNQKVGLKFSTHYKKYQPPSLQQRANDLFGSTVPQRFLKDYNAQRYWLSFNIKSFIPSWKIPAWLNIALGYGAEGMFGGYENVAHDKNGTVIFDRRDIQRYRQWYISPDIDLSKIKTKSKVLRSVFSVVNALKFPAPALQFSNNKFKVTVVL